MIKVDNYDETQKKYNITFDTENEQQLMKEVSAVVRACYHKLIDRYGAEEAKVWAKVITQKQLFCVETGVDEYLEYVNEI